MPTVLLRKDDTENVSQSYVVGEHILGRGNKLQCTSKKVSRNHCILNVTINGVFLKSTHNNPCFYKSQPSDSITMLTFGNTIKINHNDKIAMALDHGWFIVLVNDDDKTDENQSNILSSNNVTNEKGANETTITEILKRAIDNADENDETEAKKLKPDENLPPNVVIKSEPLDDAPSTSSSNNNSTNITVKQESVEELTTEVDLATEVKIEPVEDNNTNNADCKKESETKECKKEDEDVSKECKKESDDKPSTSGTRPWRDRCWYGSACYRKNGQHRVEFKHPGDSDFDSDADDKRPICCYGADCYRKNREHRKRYRHPGQTKLGAKPPPPPPQRRLRPPPNQMSQDSEELLDDYDYSDPFLDDGSEDEYEPSQNTDTESEYEDSQEAAEDHKRLLREARKFTRNQK